LYIGPTAQIVSAGADEGRKNLPTPRTSCSERLSHRGSNLHGTGLASLPRILLESAEGASMSSLLIVDDEPNVLSAMRRLCQNAAVMPAIHNPSIATFTSAPDALDYLDHHDVDIVISDYRMPEMDGASFLARVKERHPDTARIIMSACSDIDGIVRAVNQAGIFRFVSKPWSDPDFKATILEVLAHRRLLIENRELADEVRAQRDVILRQKLELERLERESPGITKVRWTEDGGVLLEE